MQYKETAVSMMARIAKGVVKIIPVLAFVFPLMLNAQTTYLAQGEKQGILLERMEIMAGRDSLLNFSKIHPFSRKYSTQAIEKYYSAASGTAGAGLPAVNNKAQQELYRTASRFSRVDLYNMQAALTYNAEWVKDSAYVLRSKHPVLRNFYRTPPNLLEVHVKDFDLVVNPVIQYVVSKEKDNSQRLFLNTRGLTLRGRIGNKIGFYTYLTDNQERDPSYVQQWISDRTAVPGEGFYKAFKAAGGVDYFDARGYVTFNVTKYIDVAFGYDKNFIGNGYRSLFLSDFGSSNLFLKLNTRIWKLNYQNLFMELNNADPRTGDRLESKKYLAVHHLDMDITRWLNVGLFEAIVFGRKDHFEFGYLNPIIFYRSAEQQNGSYDNSLIGLDYKVNFARRFQVYGQLMLDEFLLSEIKKNRGWWANKWGIQIGAKYVNAFGIRNLDLQVEHNRVRPFTYSHTDSVANYTHFNQPLAHPFGANFEESIFLARYQPAPKWMIQLKAIRYVQGRDSSAVSFGSNIFLPNVPPYRTDIYGYNIGSGWKTDVMYASLLLSYELKENMFLELSATGRKLETKTDPLITQKSTVISFGFRWNMHRREFDF